ncbi:hypothetical protein M0R45_028052 [Rubus argutus]|uniref:Uncharacterized protein n=1 Tax=Rubus argutus TaxID=59490 RepID=A0AAW1W3H0_RUBAR
MDTHSNNSLNNSPSDDLPIAQEISNPENAAEIREGGQVEESDDLPIAQGDLDNVDEDQEYFMNILDLDDHRSAKDIWASGEFGEGGQVDEEDEFLQLLTAPPSENDKRLVKELLVVSEQSCVRSPLGSVDGGTNWFDYCYANPDGVDPEPHQFDYEDDIFGDDVDFEELLLVLSEHSCVRSPLGSVDGDDIFGDDVDFEELRHLLSDDEKNRILIGVHEQQEGGQIPVVQDESGELTQFLMAETTSEEEEIMKDPNFEEMFKEFQHSLLAEPVKTFDTWAVVVYSELLQLAAHNKKPNKTWTGVLHFFRHFTFSSYQTRKRTLSLSAYFSDFMDSVLVSSSSSSSHEDTKQGIKLRVHLGEGLRHLPTLDIKVVSSSTTIAEVTEEIRNQIFVEFGHNIPVARMLIRPHNDGAEQLTVEDDSADLADHLTLEDIGTNELDLILRRTN